MSNLKRYRELGSGAFYKFSEPGQILEGVWRGARAGKFGENGQVETPEGIKMFTLNAALKDLLAVAQGTGVKIEYLGKQTAKNGNEFKAFRVWVEEDENGDPRTDDEVPF